MKRNWMALALLFCAVVVGTSCTLWGEKKHQAWKSATGGEQLVNLFWSDVKAQDWKSVEARIAPGFVGMNAEGRLDRGQVLEHLHAMSLQGFQIGEVTTQSAGADLIVTYTLQVRGTVGGQPLPQAPIRMMTVWQELKHGWVMVANSAAVVR